MAKKKQIDKQFKIDAVNYRKHHPELTMAEVANNLGISLSSIHRWIKEYWYYVKKKYQYICFALFNHYGLQYTIISTMPSADFSLFVVTALSLVRPHGISCTSFLVYLLDLHIKVTVAFWTLLLLANLSS